MSTASTHQPLKPFHYCVIAGICSLFWMALIFVAYLLTAFAHQFTGQELVLKVMLTPLVVCVAAGVLTMFGSIE